MKLWKRRAALPWIGCTAGALLLGFAAAAAPPQKSAPATPRDNRDARSILAENCFACHGPDSASRQAGLRLDRPGAPAGEILRRVLLPPGDPLHMPPASSHKRLTPAQRRTLAEWAWDGAPYQPHWAYLAPKRPALPAVKNAGWVRNPIDQFVLARLEQANLTPAPEADRRTLARRLSLDLTGLPPEPGEVERFLRDKSPGAYERLVDRLLASPHWGEHRGRYWLDAARYADTHGIHFDNYREMWSYRDWVIAAFNRNQPFDRFTLEQLAGDLLPHPTPEQRIATGFNRCNITTNEGGSIPEEVAVSYTRDRTETVAQVFLGATAGCAVCHDHKFDPLTQRGFYQLSAFFNNTVQNALDGNVKDTPPVIPVPMAKDRSRFEALPGELARARGQAEARKTAARPDFERWLAAPDVPAAIPSMGLRFHAPLNEGAGSEVGVTLDGKALRLTAESAPDWEAGQVSEKAFRRRGGSTIAVAGAGDFENDQAFSAAVWVKLAPNTNGSILARMDDAHDFRGWDVWVEGNRIGAHFINKWPANALKVVTREALSAGAWHHVCVIYNGGRKRDSIRVYVDGVARDTDAPADALKDTIRTEVPLKIGQRHTMSGVEGVAIQDVRLYDRALRPDEVNALSRGARMAYLAARGPARLSPAEKDELFGWWLTARDGQYPALAAGVAALEAEEQAIRRRGTVAHVTQERAEMPSAYVLFRGEYDKRRDLVQAAIPAFLPPMPAGYPRNRLGFARWLLRPDHPLTARVTVNRFWQETFGAGLVRTPGDFGVSGELPSHPELLDWLAVDFREGGWDVKRLFKLLVTSATYRQSATITPEKRRKDPENRLLSRAPRFRMDAEMVRDYALSAGGLLVPKIGGPSVRPYQPDGVWEAVAIIGSDTRDYRRDGGENLYRRSLYTFWKRSAPPASLDIFNAPSRETCTVRRERTNTPLQALVTLNDVQFVEAARHLAQLSLRQPGATDRADFIARRLLLRPLRPEERKVVDVGLRDLLTFYTAHPDQARALIAVGESKADPTLPPNKLAAWTMLANEMMNLDEVLCK